MQKKTNGRQTFSVDESMIRRHSTVHGDDTKRDRTLIYIQYMYNSLCLTLSVWCVTDHFNSNYSVKMLIGEVRINTGVSDRNFFFLLV